MVRVQIISVRHWSAILAALVDTIIRHTPVAPGYARSRGDAADVRIKYTSGQTNKTVGYDIK